MLTQQREVGLVSRQSEHDEVRILTTHAVLGHRVVVRLHLHGSNVAHDLVLALAWNLMAREHDLQALPHRVFLHLLADEVPGRGDIVERYGATPRSLQLHNALDVHGHARHELRARRDAVRVEHLLIRQYFAFPLQPKHQASAMSSPTLTPRPQPEPRSATYLILGTHFGEITGRAEPAGALLVQLGAWRDTIHRQVQQVRGAYDLDDFVDVLEHTQHQQFLIHLLNHATQAQAVSWRGLLGGTHLNTASPTFLLTPSLPCVF